jgi:4-hydroxybenzoate polyprenyltransferase
MYGDRLEAAVASALVTYSRMIKLSHSIFALPFALASGVLAARSVDTAWWQWVLIVLCMVTARSAAMGFNRIVDRDIDAKNPRTAGREIPSGQIELSSAVWFTGGSAALFVLFSGLLGTTTLLLSPIALAVVLGYSLVKRYTAWVHGVLGVALGIAPVAVWIALTDGLTATPVLLSIGVATWVAGFDIIYSCQDADFDSAEGLHSVPAALGIRGALWVSGLLHVVTIAALVALAWTVTLGWGYWVGVGLIAAVLAYEHAIVKPDDLSRVDKAFFDLNGYISLVFFAAVLAS